MTRRSTLFFRLLMPLLILVQVAGSAPARAGSWDLSNWSAAKTVTVGDTGTIYPALAFATGRTEQETMSSDLVVERRGDQYDVYTYTGGFLDLGAVDFNQVPLLRGDYVQRIAAVPGHVYLFSAPELSAKFVVLRTAPGQVSNIPAITLKYATSSSGADVVAQMDHVDDVKLPSSSGSGADEQGQSGGGNAPANAKATVSAGKVVLTWTASPQATRGYYVYRGTKADFVPRTPLSDFPITTGSFTDESVEIGQTYYYIIEAVGFGRTAAIPVTVTAEAEPPGEEPLGYRTLTYQVASQSYEVDGRFLPLAVPARLVSDRLMVPAGSLAKGLGGTLEEKSSTDGTPYYIMTLGQREVAFRAGETKAFVDLTSVVLEEAPMIVGGEVLIPLRLMGDYLDASIFYDTADRTATLIYPGSAWRNKPTPSGTPTGLSVNTAQGKAVVTWKPAAPAPEDGYYLYRSNEPGAFPAVPLTDFPIITESFTDETAQVGQTYYYVVEALGGGRSEAVKATISAAEPARTKSRVITFVENSRIAEVDGERRTLDVPAQLVNNRMMVPLRFIGEALDAQVLFDSGEQRITYRLDGTTVILWLGKTEASVNGQRVTLDVPPAVIQNRALIPLRFVGENLGGDVAFDAATRTATITYPKQGAGPQPVPDQPTEPEQPEPPAGDAIHSIRFGTYALRVPGMAYQQEISLTEAISTAKPGAITTSLLQINADNTYVWYSQWDQAVYTGTWRNFDDKSILLPKAQEGRDWLVTAKTLNPFITEDDDIQVYNESSQYMGNLIEGE